LPKRTRIFWPLLISVFVTDCTTKRAAVESLSPGTPHEVVGGTVRFTLTFNNSAAMGISAGGHGKKILGIVGLMVAGLLGMWYRRSGSRNALLSGALALVIAGALGNAWERLLSPRGVVDFIDVGVGALRFWTFNVADISVTVGAGLLALALWRGENTEGNRPVSSRGAAG
jgi:signal peptidase II